MIAKQISENLQSKYFIDNESILIQGDCLEVMPLIAAKSIDLILADLPYGTTKNSWDVIIPFEALWQNYERIIKDNGAIVLTSQQPFASMLIMSNPKLFRYEWIWEKEKGTGFLNANRMPLKSHENILVFYKSLPTYNPQKEKGKPYLKNRVSNRTTNYGKFKLLSTNNNGDRYPKSILKFNNDSQNGSSLHPTQKPTALLEYLIRTYTNENQTVLDNTMGSGSTCLAAKNTNRKFIGIEKEENYFDIAVKRIKNHNTLL